jgi:hypothetical protein
VTTFPAATVAEAVDQDKPLVELAVARGSQWYGLVERLETNTSFMAFRKRPHGRPFRTGYDMILQWRCGVRGWQTASDLSTLGREGVLDPMQQELLDGVQKGSVSI